MRTKKSPRRPITHEDIATALKRFQAEGGMIRELPEERTPVSTAVGEERYSAYEPLTALDHDSQG